MGRVQGFVAQAGAAPAAVGTGVVFAGAGRFGVGHAAADALDVLAGAVQGVADDPYTYLSPGFYMSLSKSYGFDVEIPFHEKDDIVWRGQLAASFFQSEDEVSARFGDVVITFALD